MTAFTDLSPTIVAQLQYPEDPDRVARAKYRGRIYRQVFGCRRCELHKTCKAPVPFRGPASARFIVCGEAPGPDEDKVGRPFVGRSGKLLDALLTDAGFDPSSDVFYTNTVSCFPNYEGKIHAPSDNETKACRHNLLDQLEAAYLPFVVLAGGRALNAFRSDLQVTTHHGQVFVWNDRFLVMPIFHPAAALRGNSGYKKLIREDLERWNHILSSGDDPLTYLGDVCYKCKTEATRWDRDGVPMCESHYKKWGQQWKKERGRWTGASAIQLTL